MKGSNGAFSLISTVCGSLATQVSMRWKIARERGDSSMWNFMIEKTTSSAENGLPSCQVTPGCRLKV